MWAPGLVWGLRTRWLSLRHSHASLLVGAICVQASFSAGKNQALKFKKAKIFVVFFLAIIYSVLPWLVWLSGLSAGLRTTGSPIQFLFRARAWVAGQVPIGGV